MSMGFMSDECDPPIRTYDRRFDTREQATEHAEGEPTEYGVFQDECWGRTRWVSPEPHCPACGELRGRDHRGGGAGLTRGHTTRGILPRDEY